MINRDMLQYPVEYYIVVDFEATCWRPNVKPHEIIEFGAVAFSFKKGIVDRYCKFVLPSENVELSEFCKDLTSITQEQVNSAESLNVVFGDFQRWCSKYSPFIWCSWGKWDYTQLKKECKRKRIHFPVEFERHRNVKADYTYYNGGRMGLFRAIDNEGLEFEGRHHRGIDDAINIANIMCKTGIGK